MSSSERTGRHAALPPASPPPGGPRRGHVARWVPVALAAPLLLAVLAALAAVVVVPRVVGGTSLVVLTGSMAPQIPAGSVVVDRPVDPRTLRVGDVVTYEVSDGSGALVTHRVVALGHDAEGQVQLTTRGDANDDADLAAVPASAVRGEVWYHVPWVGNLSNLLRGSVGGVLSERVLAFLLAGAALGAYALVQLTGAAGERRRARATWTGRTASRELLVATLEVGPGARDLDADALDLVVEEFGATVLAATDTTVSVAVTAPPAVVDDALDRLREVAPVHVQRTGALHAPLGPGAPQLAPRRGRRGTARDTA